MSTDPIPLRRVMPSAELEARRARQKARGQAARDRDFDRMQAEVEACQGECTAPGSTRGGVLLGDGTKTLGMVTVNSQGDPLAEWPEPGSGTPSTRPCFDCNRVAWERWQDGALSRKARAKVESLEDRQVAEHGRRRTREELFK